MNKKLFLIGAALAVGGTLSAQSGYRDLTKEGMDGKPVFEEAFEAPLKQSGWTVGGKGKFFKLEQRGGLNGNGGLLYHRTDPKENSSLRKKVKLREGVVYKISLDWRSEFPDKGMVELFAINHYNKNGKRLAGTFYGTNAPAVNDWKKMSRTFSVPAGTASSVVSLILRSGRIGKVWYDNVLIEAVGGVPGRIHLTSPAALTLKADGKVTFFAEAVGYTPAKNALSVAVSINGKTREAKVVNKSAALEFPNLPKGKYKFEAILKDDAKKEILARRSGYIFRNDSEGGTVRFDEKKRLIVNGKKVLPVVLFLGQVRMNIESTDEVLAKVKDAGFNTILSVPQWIVPMQSDVKARTVSAFDMAQKHGLYLIYSIKYQIKEKNSIKSYGGANGLHNATAAIVNSVKNHPALLAWYVSDENPLSELGAIQQLRELIAENDPVHPAITLTNASTNFKAFAATGDILAGDVYPIGATKDNCGEAQSDGGLADYVDAALDTALPVWNTIQIFSWGDFYKAVPLRYPTVKEMRSMILTTAIRGAHGYMFYAYHPVMYLSRAKDPEAGAKQWKNIEEAVKMLRSIENYLLSDAKAPAVKVAKKYGVSVIAGAFADENGKVMVAVSASGSGKSAAEITVPGKDNLVSKYGNTKNLGGGRYLFEGLHVDGDILLEPEVK